jgi:hypothetical protein
MGIFVPSSGAVSWQALLADPAKHWRTGYSAKSLAHCWSDADGLPAEIQTVLQTSPMFAQSQLLLAIPEHSVGLPGIGKGSQNDLWVLLRTPAALVSMAVEGKVDEPFDDPVGDWLATGSENKNARLRGLAEILGVSSIPNHIRYQLVHRTASAVLEARRFLAAHAVMLVHSFSKSGQWYDDFAAFCEALGATPATNRMIEVVGRQGPSLHLAWVTGDGQFLTR